VFGVRRHWAWLLDAAASSRRCPTTVFVVGELSWTREKFDLVGSFVDIWLLLRLQRGDERRVVGGGGGGGGNSRRNRTRWRVIESAVSRGYDSACRAGPGRAMAGRADAALANICSACRQPTRFTVSQITELNLELIHCRCGAYRPQKRTSTQWRTHATFKYAPIRRFISIHCRAYDDSRFDSFLVNITFSRT